MTDLVPARRPSGENILGGMDEPRILPPVEGLEPGDWVSVGWHSVAETSLWVRHSRSAVELRSNECTVPTLRPDLDQTEPPGTVRVYLSAYVRWLEYLDPGDAGRVLILPATVVINIGNDEVRLDQTGVRALIQALRRFAEPPGGPHE